jgi:hypothetical protein
MQNSYIVRLSQVESGKSQVNQVLKNHITFLKRKPNSPVKNLTRSLKKHHQCHPEELQATKDLFQRP